MDIKKLISKQTHKRLEKQLTACKKATPRGKQAQYELLREILTEFFPLKRILLFPNDILVDLAETIQDFHIEQHNLKDYLYYTEKYIHHQLVNYHKRNNDLNNRVEWERGRKGKSYRTYLEQLDLLYLAKSYKEGYHNQQALMYQLLGDIIKEIKKEMF